MREVEKILPKDWVVLAENAHLICFLEKRSSDTDRIDFALVVKREGVLLSYITCREADKDTLYWQFGGAFPGTKSTSLSFLAYQDCVNYCKERYKRICTLIENSNTVMLKMAMKVGFKIVGLRVSNHGVLLEHLLEFTQ